MNTIRELYPGNIAPFEKAAPVADPQTQLTKKIADAEQRLTKTLTDEQCALFRDFDELVASHRTCEEDAFVKTFRLGAQLMLDVMQND